MFVVVVVVVVVYRTERTKERGREGEGGRQRKNVRKTTAVERERLTFYFNVRQTDRHTRQTR